MSHLKIELHHLLRALDLARRAAPGWIVAWGALLIARGLLPVATVQLVRHLVDSLVSGRSGWLAGSSIMWLVLLSGTLILGELLRVADTWVRTRLSDRVGDHITELIQDTAVRVDLGFYESPDYHNRLYRVLYDAQSRPVVLLESLGALAQGAITLLGLTVLLVRFSFWLPVALLASTLPGLWFMLRHSLRQHAWKRASTERERRAAYYEALVTNGSTAAEVRMFGVGDFFRSTFRELRDGLRGERMALLRQQLRGEVVTALLGHLVAGAAVGFMLLRAAQGSVSLGEVALFYQAFSQGQATLRTIADQFRGIYTSTLFLAELFEFIELEPRVADPSDPVTAPSRVQREIAFHGVTFRYPGSTREAVSNLTLSLPAGKITAIVGPNGSGKSTLLKLLCRLYDPDQGHIYVDGTDLRRLRLEDVRRLIGVLFQVPVQYAASVRTNIHVGDVAQDETSPSLYEAAELAGADGLIARLPQGYDTPLIKGYGGVADLSIGEWQRLGLARAFLRKAEIIVLDEPTSAMDPWAEAEWLERFRHLARGRTVLIITHRFTTAMKADVIHVLEHGRIVESGTHEELVERQGLYAASWERQVQTWTGEDTADHREPMPHG